ncbi:hypothetical protein [Bradyrhizobium sp. CCBAU 45389]|uniref:hypothetical protein n=1 Tax=Bradyrhizobium sp. CCBAU 45389 TaxID=858429 RepID=UPI0023054D04|nr:hypothetical protein [Bradyrhizobium sp. CCBAU 45389]
MGRFVEGVDRSQAAFRIGSTTKGTVELLGLAALPASGCAQGGGAGHSARWSRTNIPSHRR